MYEIEYLCIKESFDVSDRVSMYEIGTSIYDIELICVRKSFFCVWEGASMYQIEYIGMR